MVITSASAMLLQGLRAVRIGRDYLTHIVFSLPLIWSHHVGTVVMMASS